MAHELSNSDIYKIVNKHCDPELVRALEILVTSHRSSADIEYLVEFIKTLEDLRNYIQYLNTYLHYQLCREFTVELFRQDEIVFNKGDFSDKLYIILAGRLEMLNIGDSAEFILIALLGPGKMIGERGLARNLPRSLSARAREDTLLLTLNFKSFKEIMLASVQANLEEKLRLLDICIPGIKKYSMQQRERIVYDMEKLIHHRGDVIIKEDTLQDYLYMIQEGTCIISSGCYSARKIITRVGANSLFGEEGVLFGNKSKFTVTVSSEYLNSYRIRKYNVMNLIPDDCIRALQLAYRAKEEGRVILFSIHNSTDNSDSEENHTIDFLKASPHARKRLKEITERTERLKSRSKNYDMKRTFTKETLEMLRTVTEKRLNKYLEASKNSKSARGLSLKKPNSESTFSLRRLRNFSINL
jgi:CRP-like cAMP-binding protein